MWAKIVSQWIILWFWNYIIYMFTILFMNSHKFDRFFLLGKKESDWWARIACRMAQEQDKSIRMLVEGHIIHKRGGESSAKGERYHRNRDITQHMAGPCTLLSDLAHTRYSISLLHFTCANYHCVRLCVCAIGEYIQLKFTHLTMSDNFHVISRG